LEKQNSFKTMCMVQLEKKKSIVRSDYISKCLAHYPKESSPLPSIESIKRGKRFDFVREGGREIKKFENLRFGTEREGKQS